MFFDCVGEAVVEFTDGEVGTGWEGFVIGLEIGGCGECEGACGCGDDGGYGSRLLFCIFEEIEHENIRGSCVMMNLTMYLYNNDDSSASP